MGTKKKQETPVTKTWIWLKSPKSKAMADMRDEFGTDNVKGLCGRWLATDKVDSDGDYRLTGSSDPQYILKNEVAHVQQSVECPKDPPVKIARIDRTKAPKAKAAKHVWTPKSFMPHPKSTKAHLEQLLSATVSQLNDLGTENAKLKNQIVSLKKKGSK